MREKSNQESLNPDFKAQFSSLPDKEILDILKKREHYQKLASEAAIQEAIKRGLIHSEQDLFAKEYQVEPLRFSIFPFIESENNRKKIRKSLLRSLLIAGVVPIVWGGLKIYRIEQLEGIALTLLGILWCGITFQLMKNAGSKMVYILFIMWAAAAIYLAKLIYSMPNIILTDIFIAVVCCLLVLYGLLFMRKLD